jgi:tRNA(Ile)-lysidine synthase
LTIRNARNGDTLSVEGGRKTIQRMFLDWKMPTELRHKWPLIVNNKGQIIYVPRYKENFVDDGTYNLVVKSKLGI